MKEKKVTRKLLSLLLMLILVLSLVACGAKHEAVKPDKDTNEIVTDKNSTKIIVDEKYTENLKKETGVQAGQVYVQDGTAIGTIVLKETVSDKDAKALADKYAKELKTAYIDMKINVQAVKAGKNIASITLEK